MKKLTAVVLVLLLLFSVPLADAYLGAVISLATVLRVGAIYIAQVWRNEAVRSVVKSVLGHIVAGTLAYLAYDRGTSAPPAERYINVDLAGVKSTVAAMAVTATTPSWSSSVPVVLRSGSQCSNGGMYNYWDWTGSPTGYTMCCTTGASLWYSAVPVNNNYVVCSSGIVVTMNSDCHVCTASDKTAFSANTQANTVMDDATKSAAVANAIGVAVQGGGTLAASPATGAVVVPLGGDVAETSSYAESNSFVTAARSSGGSSGSAGPTATEIGTAVGTAVNTNLTAIKTSTDGVKTSVDGVKTSTDGVKAAVDAINEKVGVNPGSLTAPTYDNTYTNPTENSISDRIGSFISSNPIIGAISGSHLSLSGAVCSASVGSAFEKPLTLDFCWMETYLTMFGNVMVIFAGLTAAFIIFRRGD